MLVLGKLRRFVIRYLLARQIVLWHRVDDLKLKEPPLAAYLIVDTLLDDPEGYEAYKIKAKPLAEQFGGEYLVRGGAMTVKESDLWSPTRVVLIRFADAATANRFYDSAEYQAILPISKASARRTGFVVEGV